MTQDISPEASKSRRSRWLALLFAGLVGLVIGFYQVELMRGRTAWRTYEREALGRGVKFARSDYIPPLVPDAENFASIPLMDAVFRASDANQLPPNPFALGQSHSPKLSDLWKQQHTDLVAWQQCLVELHRLPKAGDNAAADILSGLEPFAAPLQELRDASTRPRCRFPVHWEKGVAAALPHMDVLQSAAQLHALRLSAHLALGDSTAAYADFRDGFALATAMRKEPGLICGLARISIAAQMLDGVWSGLAGQQWAAPELQKIEADLAKLNWLEDYTLSVSSERPCTNEIFETVIRDPRYFATVFDLGNGTRTEFLRVYPTGWIYQSQVRANRFLDELLARVEPDHHRYFGERPTPSASRHLGSMPAKIPYMHFMMWAPVFEQIENKFLQSASITDEARIACALERFRLARGVYPASLSELAPGFIAEEPVEVVNGDSYRYRQTEDGRFLLYSVGTDLRDDGGTPNPALRPSKQADWIWSYPVK